MGINLMLSQSMSDIPGHLSPHSYGQYGAEREGYGP